MRYKSYTRVSCPTYTHKIQPLRIRPIEPIASESVFSAESAEMAENTESPYFEMAVNIENTESPSAGKSAEIARTAKNVSILDNTRCSGQTRTPLFS